jgi:hypothetical protein
MDGWAVYEDLVGQNWASLTPAQRALVGFASMRSEVDNGGFDQFFYNSSGDLAVEAMNASRSLHLDNVADLISRAMELLSGGYSSDRTVRQAALKGTERNAFWALDKEFYGLEQELDFKAAINALAKSA